MLATWSDRKMTMKEHNYNGNLRSVKRSDRVTATLSSTVCAPQGVEKTSRNMGKFNFLCEQANNIRWNHCTATTSRELFFFFLLKYYQWTSQVLFLLSEIQATFSQETSLWCRLKTLISRDSVSMEEVCSLRTRHGCPICMH